MRQHELITRLKAAKPVILPSLLQCDFADLRGEALRLEQAGAKGLHLDVMDGHFVPNLTYGMPILASLRKVTKLPLDVHLMISEPHRFAMAFCDAGADIITFHSEAYTRVDDVADLLGAIRRRGVAAGVAFNPGTPLSSIEPLLDQCDIVLVMSVEAGFGGQSFQPSALEKLRTLRDGWGDRLALEIDGGVSSPTIHGCAAAGAELFVVGSAIFRHNAYETTIQELSTLATVS